MRKCQYLLSIGLGLCIALEAVECQDEPLSKQPWSYFGPLSDYYVMGRKEKPEEVFTILKNYVDVHAKILDLGSGTGISSRQLYQQGFKNVLGVDRDPLMIEKAEAANGDDCTIRYLHGNIAEGLPFANETFDVVTAFSAFHWFANPSSIQEVARLLKPHGYYFIVGGTGHKNGNLMPPVKKRIKEIIEDRIGTSLPQKEQRRALERLEAQGSFKVVLQTVVPYVYEYTKEQYLNRIQSRSSWNFVKDRPEREAILKAIGEYLDEIVDEEGKIQEKGTLEVLLAQKIS
jgi:SAM-dependent methyltransferase